MSDVTVEPALLVRGTVSLAHCDWVYSVVVLRKTDRTESEQAAEVVTAMTANFSSPKIEGCVSSTGLAVERVK
ncbi:MAG: hypothetical protein ACK52V_10330 [Betaproteobacteria bacterium]|jgi:hypothetical protein